MTITTVLDDLRAEHAHHEHRADQLRQAIELVEQAHGLLEKIPPTTSGDLAVAGTIASGSRTPAAGNASAPRRAKPAAGRTPKPSGGGRASTKASTSSTSSATRKVGQRAGLTEEKVLAVLREHGPCSGSAVARHLDVSYPTASNWLQKLRAAGKAFVNTSNEWHAAKDAGTQQPSNVTPLPDRSTSGIETTGLDDDKLVDLVETHAGSKGLAPSEAHTHLPWAVKTRVDVHEVAQRLALLADSDRIRKLVRGRYAALEETA